MKLCWRYLVGFIWMILINLILAVIFSDSISDHDWKTTYILAAIFAFVITWAYNEESKKGGGE